MEEERQLSRKDAADVAPCEGWEDHAWRDPQACRAEKAGVAWGGGGTRVRRAHDGYHRAGQELEREFGKTHRAGEAKRVSDVR